MKSIYHFDNCRIHVSDHEAGNMGASEREYRAFCTCDWVSERVRNEVRMHQIIVTHAASHDPRPE